MTGIIAAATITEEQDFRSLGIIKAAVGEPPQFNTETGKFRRVMAGANREIADVAGHIIEAMWHGDAVRRRAKIMVVDLDRLLGIELAVPIKIADQLFFLHPY